MNLELFPMDIQVNERIFLTIFAYTIIMLVICISSYFHNRT